jgi:hypothetical protein
MCSCTPWFAVVALIIAFLTVVGGAAQEWDGSRSGTVAVPDRPDWRHDR